jgi:type I restriction-modification system DNA methylase subunit
LLIKPNETDQAIRKQFYTTYHAIRLHLITHIKTNNREASDYLIILQSQQILDRLILISFCEALRICTNCSLHTLLHRSKINSVNPTDTKLWDTLKQRYVTFYQEDINPPLKHLTQHLFEDHLDLNQLVIQDQIFIYISQLQNYNFASDLNINILGDLFEKSMIDLEEVHLQMSGHSFDKKKSQRNQNGVFYTPHNIVCLMVEESIQTWIQHKKRSIGYKSKITTQKDLKKHLALLYQLKDALYHVKILDPACGSGAFLLQALDSLTLQFKIIDQKIAQLTQQKLESYDYQQHILSRILFGVDLNPDSVRITKLVLWLKAVQKSPQLKHYTSHIKCGNSLIDSSKIDPHYSFDWALAFPEVIQDGGFDIVIGNPPYVDSELMSKSKVKERQWIAKNYLTARGNWDLYIPFMERAIHLLNQQGILCFITPDKWLGKSFGDVFRTHFFQNITQIKRYNRDLFDDAMIDSIITTFNKTPTSVLTLINMSNQVESMITKHTIDPPYKIDLYFSKISQIINKIDQIETKMSDFLPCENACATSDAYLLKKIIYNNEILSRNDLRIINTGTIAKYVSYWGIYKMTYLKDKYLYPSCKRDEFNRTFSNSYALKTITPKLIIKGLTLLDVCMDHEGTIIPGKSTLIIKSNKIEKLKILLSFLNSVLPIIYLKNKYISMSYNGGITFTKDMFNTFPFPKLSSIQQRTLSQISDQMIDQSIALYKVSDEFISMLTHRFIKFKASKSFLKWYTMEHATFVAYLRRQKLIISLADELEVLELFKIFKSKAAIIQTEIDQINKKLNLEVYQLYNMTQSEITSLLNT